MYQVSHSDNKFPFAFHRGILKRHLNSTPTLSPVHHDSPLKRPWRDNGRFCCGSTPEQKRHDKSATTCLQLSDTALHLLMKETPGGV